MNINSTKSTDQKNEFAGFVVLVDGGPIYGIGATIGEAMKDSVEWADKIIDPETGELVSPGITDNYYDRGDGLVVLPCSHRFWAAYVDGQTPYDVITDGRVPFVDVAE
jgi:hypothetical protein